MINRANDRATMFAEDGDYSTFENILKDGVSRFPINLFSFVLMPNHWHLELTPRKTGVLSKFLHWITSTHAHRWRTMHDNIGEGHLYQGRYKSFPVETGQYFLALSRYIERNPVRANLVDRAEQWRWSSLWHRQINPGATTSFLSPRPVEFPDDELRWINEPLEEPTAILIARSIQKSLPLGSPDWIKKIK